MITCYGYVRVSTNESDLDLQIDTLLLEGCQKQNIYKGKIFGAKVNCPELNMLNSRPLGDKVALQSKVFIW